MRKPLEAMGLGDMQPAFQLVQPETQSASINGMRSVRQKKNPVPGCQLTSIQELLHEVDQASHQGLLNALFFQCPFSHLLLLPMISFSPVWACCIGAVSSSLDERSLEKHAQELNRATELRKIASLRVVCDSPHRGFLCIYSAASWTCFSRMPASILHSLQAHPKTAMWWHCRPGKLATGTHLRGNGRRPFRSAAA